MSKDNQQIVDMRKTTSLERQNFFENPALKIIGLCIVILLILGFLYCFTILCNKDSLAVMILDLIKVLIGAIIGGLVASIYPRK